MVNKISSASFNNVNEKTFQTTPLSIDLRVEKVKKEILEAQTQDQSQQTKIKELQEKLKKAGLSPSLTMPWHGAYRKSTESGKLGELENELFSLQRTVSRQKVIIQKLEFRLSRLSQLNNQ